MKPVSYSHFTRAAPQDILVAPLLFVVRFNDLKVDFIS